jgi:anaphase-promoting complex subunit 2
MRGEGMGLPLLLFAALKKRLLHPGAQTPDIISQYINTVRVLMSEVSRRLQCQPRARLAHTCPQTLDSRLLDPTGTMLDRVCFPVREYLHARPDTVKVCRQSD